MRHLIGATVKLAVSQLPVLKDNRKGIGISLYLYLKQFMNTFVVRVSFLRIVPLQQELLLFNLGQHCQLGNALFGVCDNAFQEVTQMTNESRDRVGIK